MTSLPVFGAAFAAGLLVGLLGLAVFWLLQKASREPMRSSMPPSSSASPSGQWVMVPPPPGLREPIDSLAPDLMSNELTTTSSTVQAAPEDPRGAPRTRLLLPRLRRLGSPLMNPSPHLSRLLRRLAPGKPFLLPPRRRMKVPRTATSSSGSASNWNQFAPRSAKLSRASMSCWMCKAAGAKRTGNSWRSSTSSKRQLIAPSNCTRLMPRCSLLIRLADFRPPSTSPSSCTRLLPRRQTSWPKTCRSSPRSRVADMQPPRWRRKAPRNSSVGSNESWRRLTPPSVTTAPT